MTVSIFLDDPVASFSPQWSKGRKKVKMTFSHFLEDLGMVKPMEKVFFMNLTKIIGFWDFKVELICWTMRIYYINLWFLELYSETPHHPTYGIHCIMIPYAYAKNIKELSCGIMRLLRKMHFIFSDPLIWNWYHLVQWIGYRFD